MIKSKWRSLSWQSTFLNTEFFKNTSTLMIGTAGALLLSFFFQMVIRRFYSAEVFGVYDVYFQIFNVLAALATLRYDQVVMLPKDQKDSVAALVVAIVSASIICFIAFAILVFFKDLFSQLLNIPPKYSWWLTLAPLSVFLFSSFSAINYWFLANKFFKVSSINKVLRRFSEGIVQVLIGFGGKSYGLLWGDLFGNFTNALVGVFQVKRLGLFNDFPKDLSHLKQVALRYSNFPLHGLLPNLLNTFCTSLPIFYVSSFFDPHTTGQFGLARMLIAIPQAIVATSISQVLFQRFSQKISKGDTIIRDLRNAALMLLGFSVIGVALFFPWTRQLVTFLFGNQWLEASVLFRIMLLGFIFQFTVSPLSVALMATERIDLQAIWQVLYFVSIASLAFVNWSTNVNRFVLVLTVIDVISYSIYFLIIMYASRMGIKKTIV